MLAPGTMLAGRFEVVGELGHGGHGVVYRGKQRPLSRDVAIKVLRAEAATPEMLGRFGREVGLVQKLQHPNTVRLYDFGTTEEGLPFMVFELLEGRSLDHELRTSGPLSPARVARIAIQVLNALSEAHALGVVHRDIKPANVLLVDYAGEPDFVKLLDFGVARSIVQVPHNNAITREGQLVGTPAYMAPELVRDEPMTPATDVYALGLLMAEALTGKPVFKGSDVVVWLAQASAAPAPLPDAVVHSVLGPVIERATRKQVAERYGSADEMIAEIERCLAGEELAPTDPSGKTLDSVPHTERLPVPTGSSPDLAPAPAPTHAPAPTPIAHARTAPIASPTVQRRSGGLAIGLLVLLLLLAGGTVGWIAFRGSSRGPAKIVTAVSAPEIGPLGRELGLPSRLLDTGWTIRAVNRSVSGLPVEHYLLRGGRPASFAVMQFEDVPSAAYYAQGKPSNTRHRGRLVIEAYVSDAEDAKKIFDALAP